MRQIELFKDIMSYIGIEEDRIDEYVNDSFVFATEEEIKELNDLDIGNMVAHMIEDNLNWYFDSGRNGEIL